MLATFASMIRCPINVFVGEEAMFFMDEDKSISICDRRCDITKMCHSYIPKLDKKALQNFLQSNKKDKRHKIVDVPQKVIKGFFIKPKKT
jgi:hypothetical protein